MASLLLVTFAAYLAKFCAISKMTGTKQNVRGNTNVSLPLPGGHDYKSAIAINLRISTNIERERGGEREGDTYV